MATERSYPFQGGGPTSDAEWSILMRESIGTGVRVGLGVFANSTGLKVFVQPGDAKVRGHEYINENDGNLELAITAPGASARIDAVVLRLEYGSAKSITAVVKQGTATAPSLEQTETGVYEMLLAYVNVPASAVTISAANVTDRRSYLPMGVPSGVGVPFFGSVVPGGWLFMDGRLLNRVDYPTLYAAIGTTYNTGGETSAQFRIPNPRGRVLVAVDGTADFSARGAIGGERDHTMTILEMPSHAHNQYVTAGVTAGAGIRRDYQADGSSSPFNQGITTGFTGGGQPFNILQPYMAVDYIIKV